LIRAKYSFVIGKEKVRYKFSNTTVLVHNFSHVVEIYWKPQYWWRLCGQFCISDLYSILHW